MTQILYLYTFKSAWSMILTEKTLGISSLLFLCSLCYGYVLTLRLSLLFRFACRNGSLEPSFADSLHLLGVITGSQGHNADCWRLGRKNLGPIKLEHSSETGWKMSKPSKGFCERTAIMLLTLHNSAFT